MITIIGRCWYRPKSIYRPELLIGQRTIDGRTIGDKTIGWRSKPSMEVNLHGYEVFCGIICFYLIVLSNYHQNFFRKSVFSKQNNQVFAIRIFLENYESRYHIC